jgi:hypothetical protein
MGSFLRPKSAFTESDLSELEWVLEGSFRALGSPDDETKAILRRRLFVLACNGVNDPEQLRDLLVASAQQIDDRARERVRMLGSLDCG